jgi:hypothetical protein
MNNLQCAISGFVAGNGNIDNHLVSFKPALRRVVSLSVCAGKVPASPSISKHWASASFKLVPKNKSRQNKNYSPKKVVVFVLGIFIFTKKTNEQKI